MGKILDAIMTKANATYKFMSIPGNEDKVDVDAEIESLDALATNMAEIQMNLIDAEYNLKMQALPASYEIRVGKYVKERFNSDDEERFGKEGIKMTLSDLLAKANTPIEEENDNYDAEQENKRKKKAEERAQKRIAKEKENAKKRKEKDDKRDKEAKEKLAKEHNKDLLLRAHSIGQLAEHNVEDFTKTKKEEYRSQEEQIDNEAKLDGYAKGEKLVYIYNEEFAKRAKNIVDEIRKVEKKVKILQKKIEQTVKLKIAAMLGL